MRTWDNTIMLNGREDMIKQVRELCHSFNHLFSLVVLFGSTARGGREYCGFGSPLYVYLIKSLTDIQDDLMVVNDCLIIHYHLQELP